MSGAAAQWHINHSPLNRYFLFCRLDYIAAHKRSTIIFLGLKKNRLYFEEEKTRTNMRTNMAQRKTTKPDAFYGN